MPPPATKYESLMRTYPNLNKKQCALCPCPSRIAFFCVKTDNVHGMLDKICEPSPFAPKLRA